MSGLWANAISTTLPTSTNTGLTTWVNQESATVADTAAGILLTGSSGAHLHLRTKPSPGGSYTITALVAVTPIISTSNSGSGLGWYDGTNKVHIIEGGNNTTNIMDIGVDRWTSPTLFSATETNTLIKGIGVLIWYQISDDGTSVFFRASMDGINFTTIFSIAKASGFLGASGYSNVCWTCTSAGGTATLLSWAQA